MNVDLALIRKNVNAILRRRNLSREDAEDAEQEAFEGLEIALQFMAVMTAGEHDACDKGTECG